MFDRSPFIAAAFVLTLATAGCGSNTGGPLGPAEMPSGSAGADSDTTTSAAAAHGGSSSANGGSPVAASGLPCEVVDLLSTYCVACHGQKLAGGAPMALVSYEDLLAPAESSSQRSTAEVSLARMRDSASPMPPAGSAPDAAAIEAFAAWVEAGSPEQSCGDAGVTIMDPYDTPSVCSSDTYWTRGDHESPEMHPGLACINCHTRGVLDDGEREEGPRFSVAGTLYRTAHEPDDCNGVYGPGSGVEVEIKDARGKVFRLYPNEAGNFYREDRDVTFPITARVLYEGRIREMLTPQDSGDCNSCHTELGDDEAPGRIILP